jgi:hypothetical protein
VKGFRCALSGFSICVFLHGFLVLEGFSVKGFVQGVVCSLGLLKV